MIKLNDNIIRQDRFGDGTLKCVVPPPVPGYAEILWCYDNDTELFTLQCLVDYIRDKYPRISIALDLPYIPHARQDREVSDRLFTLKTFANIINSMKFDMVQVYDAHSDVSTALIDRVLNVNDAFTFNTDGYAIMFPDAGAAKKYSKSFEDCSTIIGNKVRNKEGFIEKYDLLNFGEGTKKVIIRDDICSYGGTFVAAAKELRKRGVEEIILIVTHCENNILKGEVFNYIDQVFTTDSILTVEHPQIKIARSFRNEN
jgi:ribose-phosphate pyrophosphokinase